MRAASPVQALELINWTLLLIFVVIGAVLQTGLLGNFAVLLSHLVGGHVFLGFVLIIADSAVISGFVVDNVPFIIAMMPVTSTLANQMGLNPKLHMFTMLIGSCTERTCKLHTVA